jgi:dTDP-4-dehydrorhamnose reductase
MVRIAILGAYGLLGSSLSQRLARCGYAVLRQGRGAAAEARVDPVDNHSLIELLARNRVDVVVNLVAATNVDQCEEVPQLAYRANVKVVEALASAIRNPAVSMAPHLVQISTDQVYDGIGPHGEAAADPCNVYALSKLAGEIAAEKVGATVLRTNYFGLSRCVGRSSLSDWIVHSLRSGERITVFDDVLFSALHIETLCEAIELAVRKRVVGTYNVGCKDGASKAQLAFGLARRLGLDCGLMNMGRLQDIKLRARRPLDMRMNCAQFESVFGFSAPSFESQIEIAALEYLHEKAAT